ncbi:MAG: DNA cytosine methyltransferase [Gemmatimonadaceae bacterium]
MTARKLAAVDLFAGGGGLSLGIGRAAFKVHAAVEVDADAAETYRKNHPGVTMIEKDIRKVTGEELLDAVPRRRLFLLAGCAPCQGFCSLTRKVKTEDPRNRLVLEMARLVLETRPKLVIMENVPGLATRGAKLFGRFIRTLTKAGYVVQWRVVQMADYGVPQNRKRLVLLAGKGLLVDFPAPTHAKRPDEKAKKKLKPWRTLENAIGDTKSRPVLLGAAKGKRAPRPMNWHVVRDLEERTREQLRAAKPGGTWLDIDPDLRPECHREGYIGFRNVYGRMRWDQLPVTITAGCTTPAKGRFGHPTQLRTISVREAASIQTFPKSYRLATDRIDTACEQIGNAVPPLFAERLARAARASLPV